MSNDNSIAPNYVLSENWNFNTNSHDVLRETEVQPLVRYTIIANEIYDKYFYDVILNQVTWYVALLGKYKFETIVSPREYWL